MPFQSLVGILQIVRYENTLVQKRIHRRDAKNAEKEYFIRIPERGILIKMSTILKTICCFCPPCPGGTIVPSGQGLVV